MHVDAVFETPADLGRRITFVAQFANVFELRRILQLDVCRGWQIRRNADQFAARGPQMVARVPAGRAGRPGICPSNTRMPNASANRATAPPSSP